METLLFRVDAGPEIGAGHLLRCLALAEGWRDRGGRVLFVSAAPSPALEARLSREGAEIHRLGAAAGSGEDAEETAALARQRAAGWVVVDGYVFDAEYRHRLRRSGIRLLWIDDQGHADDDCADLVLNQNLYATEELYPRRQPHTRLLLGERYVLLRREFRRWRSWRREVPAVASKVLWTMGGADPHQLTPRFLGALAKLGDGGPEILAVVGHLAAREPALAAVAGDRGIRLRSGVEDMAELMAWADLAVSAAGSTAWELAHMGLPALLLVTAENQRPVAEALVARGAARSLGDHGTLDPRRLAAEVRRLARDPASRAAIARRGRRLVDGDGVERVVDRLAGGGGAPELRLRPVRREDRELLWEWATDPEVRATAFSSDPIPWQDHVRWFDRKLGDSSCIHYLAADAHGSPLGQVRFDLMPAAEARSSAARVEAEISVSIAREHRGAGHGGPLLCRAAARLFRETEVAMIHAFIRPHNQASVRAFEKAGFTPRGRAAVRGHRALHYVLSRSPEEKPR